LSGNILGVKKWETWAAPATGDALRWKFANFSIEGHISRYNASQTLLPTRANVTFILVKSPTSGVLSTTYQASDNVNTLLDSAMNTDYSWDILKTITLKSLGSLTLSTAHFRLDLTAQMNKLFAEYYKAHALGTTSPTLHLGIIVNQPDDGIPTYFQGVYRGKYQSTHDTISSLT